ncbi:transposase domain-containing protein, partial [Escherichia coli]|uniref:transposase domain-containing protein n=2 Tax=Escherichia coli TaxID=562 RepID=UPI0021BA558B
CPLTDFRGKTSIFSHPVYLFLRKFSLQDSRGGSGHTIYVFFGSDHGGERGALLYGLIGTCRLNGIDPEAYLRHILSVLPEWPSNRVGELLPWNVVLTNK